MKRTTAPVDRATQSFGLAGWRGRPDSMRVAHSHNDVELNYIEQGAAIYEFGGEQVALRAGDVCLFWAARPHQLRVGEEPPTMHWLTLPLARFLSWRLPEPIAAPVLRGTPAAFGHGAADDGTRLLFRRWNDDLARGGPERQRIVCLEVEAFLRRLALAAGDGTARPAGVAEGRRGHAERMAQFMAGRYTEPLTVAEIAASAGIHPHYAMQVFRAAYGISLLAYLTQQRVAHAQMLLATTDTGVLEIGLMSGFASASRFYSAFKAACGVSPGAYRSSMNLPNI